jgi:hypothetical protein
MAIGATFALCDFLLPPAFLSLNGPPKTAHVVRFAGMLGMLGCTLAQGNLLAVWLVWSSKPFARRLASHWAAAGGLYLCWLAGLALSARSQVFRDASLSVAVLVPAVSLGAQLPHWIMRHYFGWRLVHEDVGVASERDAPLTIRDLLMATVVVAATFAIARQSRWIQPGNDGRWMLVAMVMTIAGFISTIALLPAGALLFKAKNFQRGLAWSGAYISAFIALEWAIVGILWWYAPQFLLPYQLYVGLSSLMLCFAGTLIVVAWAARADGYRLVSGRNASLNPQPQA